MTRPSRESSITCHPLYLLSFRGGGGGRGRALTIVEYITNFLFNCLLHDKKEPSHHLSYASTCCAAATRIERGNCDTSTTCSSCAARHHNFGTLETGVATSGPGSLAGVALHPSGRSASRKRRSLTSRGLLSTGSRFAESASEEHGRS